MLVKRAISSWTIPRLRAYALVALLLEDLILGRGKVAISLICDSFRNFSQSSPNDNLDNARPPTHSLHGPFGARPSIRHRSLCWTFIRGFRIWTR